MNRLAALAVSAVITLTACSSASVPASGSASPASISPTGGAAPVKLSVWQFGSPNTKRPDGVTWEDWWSSKIKDYTSKNPNVVISFAAKGQEAGGTTLSIDAALAAGSPPDISFDVVFRQAKYAAVQGLLEPVDSVLSADDWKALDPGAVKTVSRSDGKRWGVPVFVTPPFVLAVNKTLATAAGAAQLLPADPDRDWTTDQFVAFLKAVAKPPQRYGTILYAKTASSTERLSGYAGGFGAAFYKGGDYCRSAIDSPEGARWMDWMNGLVKQGLALPGAAGLADADQDAAWSNQQVVVVPGTQTVLDLSKKLVSTGQVKDLDVFFVNYPHEPGVPPPPPAHNAPWAATIFKQSDPAKRDAAVSFLKFLANEPTLTDFATGFGTISPYTAAASRFAGSDANYQFLFRMVRDRGVQDMGYAVKDFNGVRLAWATARQRIWSGTVDSKQGLQQFAQEAAKLLCP